MSQKIILTLHLIEDGDQRRLVLHRRIIGRDAASDEVWRSGRVSELAVAAIGLGDVRTEDWRLLALGLAVPEVRFDSAGVPITLTLLTPEEFPAARDDMADQARVLLTVSARHTDRSGVLEPAEGELRRGRDEESAGGFLRSAADALNELGLVPRTSTARYPADDRLPAIELRDVRGVQIGDHNHQINRFIVSRPDRPLDFEQVIRKEGVQRAIKNLLADPGREGRRADLVAALRNEAPGLQIFSDPLTLSARSVRPGLWDRMMAFDAQGLQVGDHNKQRNTFRYTVVDEPSAAQMLRSDKQLARVLADYLCPRVGLRDDSALNERIDKSFSRLPHTLDRRIGNSYRSPQEGKRLFIAAEDGVMVGDRNKMTIRTELKVKPRLDTVHSGLKGATDAWDDGRRDVTRDEMANKEPHTQEPSRHDRGMEIEF